jgi:hypothetical protein
LIDEEDEDSVPGMPDYPSTTTSTTTGSPKDSTPKQTDSRPSLKRSQKQVPIKRRPSRRPIQQIKKRAVEPKIPLPPKMQVTKRQHSRPRRAREVRVYVDVENPRK